MPSKGTRASDDVVLTCIPPRESPCSTEAQGATKDTSLRHSILIYLKAPQPDSFPLVDCVPVRGCLLMPGVLIPSVVGYVEIAMMSPKRTKAINPLSINIFT